MHICVFSKFSSTRNCAVLRGFLCENTITLTWCQLGMAFFSLVSHTFNWNNSFDYTFVHFKQVRNLMSLSYTVWFGNKNNFIEPAGTPWIFSIIVRRMNHLVKVTEQWWSKEILTFETIWNRRQQQLKQPTDSCVKIHRIVDLPINPDLAQTLWVVRRGSQSAAIACWLYSVCHVQVTLIDWSIVPAYTVHFILLF